MCKAIEVSRGIILNKMEKLEKLNDKIAKEIDDIKNIILKK